MTKFSSLKKKPWVKKKEPLEKIHCVNPDSFTHFGLKKDKDGDDDATFKVPSSIKAGGRNRR